MKLPLLLASAGASLVVAMPMTILSTIPAHAIDCSKASSQVEKAICASPEAHAADDAMAAAYTALRSIMKPTEQKALAASQGQFIAGREDCTADDSGTGRTDAQIAECVVEKTSSRAKILAGKPAGGPGTSDPIRMIVVAGADQVYHTSLAFIAPQTPAEKLFNATMAKHLSGYRLAKTADGTSDTFDAVLMYGSPDFVSVNLAAEDDTPGLIHPMASNTNLNMDMKTGKILKMADFLSADALAKIEDQCLAQLKDYMSSDTATGEVDPVLITTDIEDLARWSFGASGASLVFDPVTLDPASKCSFDYKTLQPLVKPGFPLPQG
jgi:uncharacterized protein YecT (DUF1311 family)